MILKLSCVLSCFNYQSYSYSKILKCKINLVIHNITPLLRCRFVPGALGKGEKRKIDCAPPRIGRFVFVVLRVREYLTLCEVEVFGESERESVI